MDDWRGLVLARRQHLYDCPQLFVAQRFFPKCELQVGGNLGEDFCR